MRTLLCIVLALYSLCVGAYTLSDVFTADGACTNCYQKETAYGGGTGPNGEASTPQNRYVSIAYVNNGPGAFTGADATKIKDALNIASTSWNTQKAEDNTSEVPYHFYAKQQNSAEIKVELVDKVPGDKDGTSCGGFLPNIDKAGNMKGGIIYMRKDLVQAQTKDQLAKIIEHELGHFMGLVNIDKGRTGQCQSIMDRAGANCVQTHSISKGDVTTVNKYVNNNNDCNRKRGVELDLSEPGGGYMDPTPIYYYPPTCYYFYDVLDVYQFCDCVESGSPRGYRYVGSIYYLTDVFCY